jgi:glutamine amidotransferase
MQLLFGGSSESPDREGFGLLKGQLRHLSELDRSQIVPSIGWKALQTQRNVFDDARLEMAYFVHSYFVSEIDPSLLVSTYDWHSFSIPAHVSLGLVHGVQFHPEKSRSAGVEFLGSLIRGLTK